MEDHDLTFVLQGRLRGSGSLGMLTREQIELTKEALAAARRVDARTATGPAATVRLRAGELVVAALGAFEQGRRGIERQRNSMLVNHVRRRIKDPPVLRKTLLSFIYLYQSAGKRQAGVGLRRRLRRA